MTALQELLMLPARTENQYLKQWIGDGGKVVGFSCVYAPEEIIHAAGVMPYRMEARGMDQTDLADVYLHRFNCTFARCMLQAGLGGEYDFLDGFCFLNGCEQIRRLYEIWDKHIPATDYQYMVTIPHSIYDAGFEWYLEETGLFKEKLATDFSKRCSDTQLAASIKTYNKSRELVARLYELRKRPDVPVSGKEAMGIMLAAGIMPREKYNELLEEALAEIEARPGNNDYSARLMLGGSAVDDPKLLELIEGLGGVVVTDSLCYGSRYFLNPVEENGDPLKAIAKRYYYNNPCPRMMNQFENRQAVTEKLAREADVDGVILQKIVFCDNHAVDCTMLADELEQKGIPTMVLEREHMFSDVGRLKTRIEAFMERIARR